MSIQLLGYTIKQINEEFDLLRFGDSYIFNIEVKSELKVTNKIKKLLSQMRKNYYYLVQSILGCFDVYTDVSLQIKTGVITL